MRRLLVGIVFLYLGCKSTNDPPPDPGPGEGGAGGLGGQTSSGGASGGPDAAATGGAKAGAGGTPMGGAGGGAAGGGAGGGGGAVTGGKGGGGGTPIDATVVDTSPPVDQASDKGPPDRAMAADAFFNLSIVHRIDITVSAAEWADFMREHANTALDPLWRQADFKIDGVAFSKVGYKSFGFGSRLFGPNKPNLSLDLNKYVAGQSINGLTRMRIKNNGQDPSGLRQAITYEAMRAAGVGAPRAGFVEVFVNGENYGIFTVEEPFTSSFVLERTGNDNGPAYEADDCKGFVAPPGGCANLPANFSRSFNPLAGAGEDLVAMCNVMNGPVEQFMAGIAPLVDLPQWVTSIAAATAVAGDYDGFSTNGNNYRLYHNTANNKMLLYMFGPDVTYDSEYLPFPDPLKPAPAEDCQMRNPSYKDLFLEKLLATPAGLDMYTQAVKKLRGGVMSPAVIKQRVDALWALVGARVVADPKRDKAPPDPETSKERIKIFMDQRSAALQAKGL
jgi:hypothetical protein